MDRPCQCGILKPRSLMGSVPAIRDHLSGSKPRMRGFEPGWYISCSRSKHCAMVPVLAAIRPVVDDDALPRRGRMMRIQTGWNFSERTDRHLSGCPSSSPHAENSCSLSSFFELDFLKK